MRESVIDTTPRLKFKRTESGVEECSHLTPLCDGSRKTVYWRNTFARVAVGKPLSRVKHRRGNPGGC